MDIWTQLWTALAGLGAIGGAIATFLTYGVVKRYTEETQKLREAANKQLEVMTAQAELTAKIASAQSVLTFTFGREQGNVEMPNVGKCWAYPLIVEGSGLEDSFQWICLRDGLMIRPHCTSSFTQNQTQLLSLILVE